MSATVTVRGPRSRNPGILNLAIGALIMLFVIPLALKASQPPPPQIAEFSPPATQIKEAAKEQAAAVGAANGGGSGSGLDVLPSPPVDTHLSPSPHVDPSSNIDAARTHHCVGNPARQIEDPQSPPCVPFWDNSKGNGGATAPGVTGDTINIGVACCAGTANMAEINLYQNFFNSRFEFYGRKLKLIPRDLGAASQADDPVTFRQQAQMFYAPETLFGEAGYLANDAGGSFYFYDALAEKPGAPIISVESGQNNLVASDEAHFRRKAPYEWNYPPSTDVDEAALAEIICNSLKDKPAIHSSDALYQGTKRKFGLIFTQHNDGSQPLDTKPLISAVRACGAPLADADIRAVNGGQDQEGTALVALHQDNVTTLITMLDGSNFSLSLTPEASAQGYHPEWLVSGYVHLDTNNTGQTAAQDQVQDVLGIRSLNKMLPLEQTPAVWALNEEQPGYGGGTQYYEAYHDLLVLASGIQMAGPHLTAQTFQEALFNTRFPNPNAGTAPFYQATVGFPRVHTFIQDFGAIAGFDASVSDTEGDGHGAWCMVQRGRRFALGSWPAADIFGHPNPCL